MCIDVSEWNVFKFLSDNSRCVHISLHNSKYFVLNCEQNNKCKGSECSSLNTSKKWKQIKKEISQDDEKNEWRVDEHDNKL